MCIRDRLQGEHGVTWPRPFDFGGIDFGGINGEARVIGHRQADHRQALPCSHLRRAAQRRLAGRNPAHAGQVELVGGFFGEAQVAEMDRVEGAAKNPQRPVT